MSSPPSRLVEVEKLTREAVKKGSSPDRLHKGGNGGEETDM